jgi:hypothetical protein
MPAKIWKTRGGMKACSDLKWCCLGTRQRWISLPLGRSSLLYTLLLMLFSQEEIFDELLECVLEITNQSLVQQVHDHQSGSDSEGGLLHFLLNNGLLLFLTSFFTSSKKKTLKKQGATDKVVKSIQRIMQSDSCSHERILEEKLSPDR